MEDITFGKLACLRHQSKRLLYNLFTWAPYGYPGLKVRHSNGPKNLLHVQ
jgi:hypothetical protein